MAFLEILCRHLVFYPILQCVLLLQIPVPRPFARCLVEAAREWRGFDRDVNSLFALYHFLVDITLSTWFVHVASAVGIRWMYLLSAVVSLFPPRQRSSATVPRASQAGKAAWSSTILPTPPLGVTSRRLGQYLQTLGSASLVVMFLFPEHAVARPVDNRELNSGTNTTSTSSDTPEPQSLNDKKTWPMLAFVGIAVAFLVIIGIAGLAIALRLGPSDDLPRVSSSSHSSGEQSPGPSSSSSDVEVALSSSDHLRTSENATAISRSSMRPEGHGNSTIRVEAIQRPPSASSYRSRSASGSSTSSSATSSSTSISTPAGPVVRPRDLQAETLRGTGAQFHESEPPVNDNNQYDALGVASSAADMEIELDSLVQQQSRPLSEPLEAALAAEDTGAIDLDNLQARVREIQANYSPAMSQAAYLAGSNTGETCDARDAHSQMTLLGAAPDGSTYSDELSSAEAVLSEPLDLAALALDPASVAMALGGGGADPQHDLHPGPTPFISRAFSSPVNFDDCAEATGMEADDGYRLGKFKTA